MLHTSSSVFETLPARPPTPPKDISKAVNDAIDFLDDSNEIEQRLKHSRDQGPSSEGLAPQSSPASPTSSHASKRVGFSPHLKYHKIAAAGPQSSPITQSLKRIPLAKEARPLRSILKQSDVPPPLTPDDLETRLGYFSPEDPGSFAKMLQSVVQQLAGPSVSSRLDAYLALNGALKAYDGVPDRQAMIARMSLLMQFMSRDMVWKNASGALDINIITQSLKLAVAILYDSKLAAALDDDFRTFLIDRSIGVLEFPDIPKAIIKTHLYMLAQPRFHSAVMSAGQVDKLITLLQTVEDRCSGNGAIATRLVIYQRLLERATAVMANRMRDWLEHVLHGMLSSIKDVRIRAIETCALAGMILGTQSYAAKMLNEMFDTEVEEGQSYCDFYSLRLMQMISDRELGPYVPQIWSAVILFFRSKGRPLERWSKMKTWLLIIQKGLNASDLETKHQAHLAWNKLMLGVLPDSSTSRTMFSMLKIPVVSGLEKKGADNYMKQSRQYALGSYYNLLHYGLRPGLTYDELDAAWEMYVYPVLSEMIRNHGSGRDTACRVLQGLFTLSNDVWNSNAANETTPIRPEDLPRLEPRWVRSRLQRPLKLLQPLLQGGMWLSTEANAAVDSILLALVGSVAEAGSQEVKTSNELKEAIALLVSMLHTLWTNATEPPANAQTDAWIRRYVTLVETIVGGIGSTHFSEDILTRTKDDKVEAAITPSHRSSKHHTSLQAPLVFLFGQLYQPPPTVAVETSYLVLAWALLDLLTSCKASMLSRLNLLSRSLHLWSQSSPPDAPTLRASELWSCVANCAEHIIERDCSDADSHGSQHLGHGMRDATDILFHGIQFASRHMGAEKSLIGLYQAMSRSARTSAGSGGQVLAVIEPVAKALICQTNDDCRLRLNLAKQMLDAACWPRSRLELDHARKTLWGVGLAPHKTAVFNPYEHLYTLVLDVMGTSYSKLEKSDAEELGSVPGFFASCMVFLDSCPLSLVAVVLRKLQDGFVYWFEDKSRITSSNNLIAETVRTLGQDILRLIKTLPQHDTALLKALEPLLVAAFSSPHKAIVNATITFWNTTFGCQSALEYPPGIEGVLRARLAETDLALPNFPESVGDSGTVVLPAFYESQTSFSNAHQQGSSSIPGGEIVHVPLTALARQSAQSSARKALPPRLAGVSSAARSASNRTGCSTTKARLRHDDSQIQFAPIESSPVRLEGESQHLTDHQKDVRDKQLDNMQMFPALSSSPVAQQPAPARSMKKRLDFTTDVEKKEPEAAVTRTGLQDPDFPMSDDIPSSPTPSSTRDPDAARIDLDEDQVSEGHMDDPPSSPPQSIDDEGVDRPDDRAEEYEIGPNATTIVDTGFGAGLAEHNEHIRDAANGELPEFVGSVVDAHQVNIDSDLPSDTPLPAEQLQQEELMATEAEIARRHNVQDGDKVSTSSKWTSLKQPDNVAPTERTDEQEGNETTRIDNSFAEPAAAQQEDDGSTEESQQIPPASKKRKRSSTHYTAKKRKQQSPFKRFMSSFNFLGRSQEEENDDIGEEIVVASSQVPSSPESEDAEQAPEPSAEEEDGPARPAEEHSTVPAEDTKLPPEQPAKRSRGRPRKSETPTPIPHQSDFPATRSLKRKASALSTADDTEANPATSFVKDTPAPAKARKQNGSHDVKAVNDGELPQSTPETGRTRKRAVTAVVIPGTHPHVTTVDADNHASADDDHQSVTPEQQLANEAAAAIIERPIATPKSLLTQLKGILSVLPRMVLGPQEEREVDDVLFEIRREVHEAGSRGRAQE